MTARYRGGWLALVLLWLAGCQGIAGTAVQSIVQPTGLPVVTATTAFATDTPAPPTSTPLPALPETPLSLATTSPLLAAVPTTAAAATVEAPTPTRIIGAPSSLVATSAGGRAITSFRLGDSATAVVVVGGMHGGYEWNSILLAEGLLAHYAEHPEQLPGGVSLYIIPNANPDGLFAVAGTDGPFAPADIAADSLPGRFNANGVDLNRNWDCRWAATALWRDREVSGGPFPFSEPETRGLRDYLLALDPAVVVFLHSQANAVFVAGCGAPHPPSYELASVYGQAAGYPVHETFDLYPITGDAGDWLTEQGIPSFSVELYSHESLDWEQNLAGLGALLAHYGRPHSTPAAIEVTP